MDEAQHVRGTRRAGPGRGAPGMTGRDPLAVGSLFERLRHVGESEGHKGRRGFGVAVSRRTSTLENYIKIPPKFADRPPANAASRGAAAIIIIERSWRGVHGGGRGRALLRWVNA